MLPLLTALVPALCGLSAPALEAQVGATLFEVADSTELADAVQQASHGDTILLAPGDYTTEITLDGLGVTLCGAADGVRLLGSLYIQNLPATRRVTISNLEMRHPNGGYWWVTNNAGAVWFSDVVATGGPEAPANFQVTWFSILLSDNVVFERCQVTGTTAYNTGPFGGGYVPPSAGLYISDSTVWLYDTAVRGGDNPPGSIIGYDGIRITSNASLHLSNSLVTGSDAPMSGTCGGYGGDGIQLEAGQLFIYDRGSVIQGGYGEQGPLGCPPETGLGADIAGDLAQVTRSPWLGLSPSLQLDASTPVPLEEGSTADLRVTSGPGELVLLLASAQADSAASLPLGLQLAEPLVLSLGSTDGAGSLSVSAGLWAFGGSAQVLSAGAQAVVIDPLTLELGLSNPLALTVIDAQP